MLTFNKKTNTLEQLHYTYDLHDVKEPKLYREIFDYNKIPKIPFNHRRVPMQPPDQIWITDTTFRDGQQSMPPYTVKQIGIKIPPNYPFVGSDFNVTRAGIHADGIAKDEEIYNIFNTEKLLNRPVKIGIKDKSGRAGIAYWVNSYFGLDDNKKIHKNHSGVNKITKWVESEFANGRITSVSDRELLEQVKRYMPELLESAEDCER